MDMDSKGSSSGARERRKKPRAAADATTGGDNDGSLTGLAAVQGAFHFLPAPADVLRAAAACRRWRELACADSVWRARFEREGLVDKARLFEVALPLVPPVQGGGAEGGGGGNGTTTASERDELAGVGLAFYAQVFALKVRGTTRPARPGAPPVPTRLTTAPRSHPLLPRTVLCNAQKPDLSEARQGGCEWDTWAAEALASEDGAFWRPYWAEDYSDDPEGLDERVLDRMAAFCQTCMQSHVPSRGYVAWFPSSDRDNSSACLECMHEIPPAERPDVDYTD